MDNEQVDSTLYGIQDGNIKDKNEVDVENEYVKVEKEDIDNNQHVLYAENELNEVFENMSIKDLGRFRKDPIGYVKKISEETSAFYQGKDWRGYHNYIGTKLFVQGKTKEINDYILKSEKIQKVINELVDSIEKDEIKDSKYIKAAKIKELKEVKDSNKRKKIMHNLIYKKTSIVLDKLSADLTSAFNIKALCYSLNIVFTRMYHQGIYINEAQFQKIRKVAIEAASKNIPLIVLPCHKSHIDYLVISYIFVRLGLAVPFIAAGDNLNLPIIGPILRKGGAFFIRRSWGDDKIYGNVAREYIHEVLSRGYNMEVFIEGTRSRTGKLLNPKFGILNIILDGLLEKRYEDCIVLPISIGYDRVIETSSYVNELLGIPKEKESLMGFLNSTSLLQLKWGRVEIRFSEPFSLRGFVDNEVSKRSPDTINNTKIILRALGYRAMSDINAASVVMPTALVGTVLLTLRGRGVGFVELIRRVKWLKHHIILKGGRVAYFGGMKLEEVVVKAIRIIKDLIGTHVGLAEPVYFAINRFELSFYRNQVIHIFISEAIVSVAMYTVIKKGGSKLDQRIPFEQLLNDVSFLSQLLKLEFVYPPGTVKDNLLKTLEFLEKSKVISYDGTHVELNELERSSGRENYDFYCFLLWPFVESYWLATVSLYIISSINESEMETMYVEENEFKNKVQILGKTLYYEGDLSYLEAINKETVNNAFRLLKEGGIIDTDNNKFISINKKYFPIKDQNGTMLSKGKLWELVDTIGAFRREGKNRRDNATVSIRVLRLAEIVGKSNWTKNKNLPPLPSPPMAKL